MRLALATGTPIVPVAFVGTEEQQPGLANLRGVAETVGLPSLPITVTFPWLGPLGLLVAAALAGLWVAFVCFVLLTLDLDEMG